MSPTFISVSAEHATAIAPGIFVFYVRRLPSIQTLLQTRQEIDTIGSKKPLRGYVQIMAPREIRQIDLEEAMRNAWIKLAEAAKRNADYGAIAVLQEGFAGAALRAAVSTVLLLSRGKKPARVFDSVNAASSWLAEQLAADPGALSATEIRAVAMAVMAKVNAPDISASAR